MNQREPQAQQRVRARAIHFNGLAKAFRRRFPVLQVTVANAQVEMADAVPRLDRHQSPVAFRRGLELRHLALNMAQRRIEPGFPFPTFDGFGQHPGGAFALALQMQRNRPGQRLAGSLGLHALIDGQNSGRNRGFGCALARQEGWHKGNLLWSWCFGSEYRGSAMRKNGKRLRR